MEALAREVLRLSRNTLLVQMRFLETALSRFTLQPADDGRIGTDGETLRFSPRYVLRSYRDERDRLTRDYLHLVLHCTFRHAFTGPTTDRDCWDLACDVAVEAAIDSIGLACVAAARCEQQTAVHRELADANVPLTAEKIYRFYLDKGLKPHQLQQRRQDFLADDHAMWYAPVHDREEPEEDAKDAGEQAESDDAKNDPNAPQDGGSDEKEEAPGKTETAAQQPPEGGEDERQDAPSTPQPDGPAADDDGQPPEEKRRETPAEAPEDAKAPQQGEKPQRSDDDAAAGEQDERGKKQKIAEAGAEAGGKPFTGSGEAGLRPDKTPMTRKELEEIWSGVARHMKVDMETMPLKRGEGAGAMLQNLTAVTREKYDYADFLRQFAVLGEAVRLNDDEFDYIYYTYGLSLYGRMPLVEPLEYKEQKRIREFVIAIDTSGSVKGEQVQRFIQKTYNILMERESFFTKIDLHILQCDAAIQEVRRITSREEFLEYLDTMTLKGFGGTDFRPVFAYVDRMLAEHVFTDLRGLIYFTDGDGVYPAVKPPYDTAFVFVRDDYEAPRVPVWATRLLLDSDDI